MYINDVPIYFYILFIIMGIITARLVEFANIRLPKYEKVFTLKYFKYRGKIGIKSIILMIVNVALNVAILYRYGISNSFFGNLELIKYMILTPMLLSVFAIDYKLQIIPNRLNLVMFEIGLIIAFIYGLSDISITINMLLGMLAGGGIFLLITLVGGAIYGKEAMGLGDVKLMGALGLYFGLSNIVAIALMSFLIGAIISIFLIATKIKKTDEYIPFGPFIVIASFISILIPFNIILDVLYTIFTLGLFKRT